MKFANYLINTKLYYNIISNNLLSNKNFMPCVINSKTISRIASIQSIYCYYATNLDINKIIQDVEVLYADPQYQEDQEIYETKLHKNLFMNLVVNTINNIMDIDKAISVNLMPKWPLENLHLTLISILRVGTSELYYHQQTPFKVVINEFTNISSQMLSQKEVPFINSILQKIHDQNNLKQNDLLI
jgi:N utilization substance protein B